MLFDLKDSAKPEPADSKHPRVFAQPMGCDFLADFLQHLESRLKNHPPEAPEAMANIDIFVNAQRVKRRLINLLSTRTAGFLPRIHLINNLAAYNGNPIALPAQTSPLRRRLALGQAVRALLNAQPDIAPLSACYDLADSLAALLDEMHEHGCPPDIFKTIAPDNQSEYWQRSLKFLDIIAAYDAQSAANDLSDSLKQQKYLAEHYAKIWQKNPPQNPVFVIGSTGSREPTAIFMRAVAQLPQGCVILPGFDCDLPATAWESLQGAAETKEHSQAAIARFLNDVDVPPDAVQLWGTDKSYNPARAALVSLALRPAPLSDQWYKEGRTLAPQLENASQDLTLLEANDEHEEALALSLILRNRAEAGGTVMLIAPSATLARRISANLLRWDIIADNSVGEALGSSPTGVFLSLVSGLIGRPLELASFLALLKHPFTRAGDKTERATHLKQTRLLERHLLRGGTMGLGIEPMLAAAKKHPLLSKVLSVDWLDWLGAVFKPLEAAQQTPFDLGAWVMLHQEALERLTTGAAGAINPALWAGASGGQVRDAFDTLKSESPHGGTLHAFDYHALISFILKAAELRAPAPRAHPLIQIRGTLEARAQGADLVILSTLNEGQWPHKASWDAWLNRPLREQIGLSLPEQHIGLAAHDFQSAINAREVILSRALRTGDTPNIASRWLSRLTNFFTGLGEEGQAQLSAMRARGQVWCERARHLEKPSESIPPAPRPAPILPPKVGLKKLSVTQIKTLILDPYQVYARAILRLRKIPPLGQAADALIRGTALHRCMEEFGKATKNGLPKDADSLLIQIAAQVMEEEVPWPAHQKLWVGRIGMIAKDFVTKERNRRTLAEPFKQELYGEISANGLDFTLTVKADRIDKNADGAMLIFDYKSGSIPTKKQVEFFDKQLLLSGAIMQQGGFKDLPASAVSHLEYISLGRELKTYPVPLDGNSIDETWRRLVAMIASYQDGTRGFIARDKPPFIAYESDYDHLARLGEWSDSDAPSPQKLKGSAS